MSKAFDKIKAGLDEALIVAPYLAKIERLRAERDAQADNAAKMNEAASRYLRRAEQAEKERDKWIEKCRVAIWADSEECKELTAQNAKLRVALAAAHKQTIEECAQSVEQFECNVPPTLKKKAAKGFMLGRDATKRILAAHLRMNALDFDAVMAGEPD